jgi:VanZ family protein
VSPSRYFLPATLIVLATIVHGSLYPYDFRVPPGGIGAVATLLGSWAKPPSSYGDLVANVLLYMPLGFFVGLSVGRGRWRRVLVATFVGLALCTSIELAQYYDIGRDDSMSDVYLNTFGSLLGAIAALALGSPSRYLPVARLAANPFPVLLLVAMLGYHLFPYVPTIDLHKYWQALKPLVIAPRLSAHDVLRYTALWLTASCLLGTVTGFARSRLFVLLFMAGVFAAKVMIASLFVTPSEALGAALALLLWFAIGYRRRPALVVTTLVLGVSIIVERLEPFRFQETARAFGWLPFRGFLGGSLSINTTALMEKFFLYGSLIWLQAEALFPLWLSTTLVALLLFATSVAEIYLPGRSGEITDAVMAVVIGLVMMPFLRQALAAGIEPSAPMLRASRRKRNQSQ